MSEAPPLRAEGILGALERHRVEYVLVGGYAAQLHGSPERTRDVDVVPASTAENLHRLAAALDELGARVRTDEVPEGLPFATSAQALVGVEILNLVTDHGEVDLIFTPSGTQGYPDLVHGAVVLAVGRGQVQVASLADVIRSKQAAGRGKDLRVLPGLGSDAWPRDLPSGGSGAGGSSRTPRRVLRPARPRLRHGASRSCQRRHRRSPLRRRWRPPGLPPPPSAPRNGSPLREPRQRPCASSNAEDARTSEPSRADQPVLTGSTDRAVR